MGFAPRSDVAMLSSWLCFHLGNCTVASLRNILFALSISIGSLYHFAGAAEPVVHLRANQVGYLADDAKVAIAFSRQPVEGEFTVVDEASGEVVFSGQLAKSPVKGWGDFEHYYQLDFSEFQAPGRYLLRIAETEDTSRPFTIGADAYRTYQEDLLEFMRQQRCGYNPMLDRVCHQRDGRTAYGPYPAGTFVDASGGWHDAGDQLKYLITSSNATARMLHAYLLEPDKFADRVDHLGHPLPNGIPDVLDEAKWGLDWLHKLHPKPGELFHQVADDRDHTGWKYPDEDDSDYGWGPNSYRVLYFADGKPQGLAEHQSEATGIANLAGRYAAAMAMAYCIWKDDLNNRPFADKCLRAAVEVYAMGKRQEGFQQGNSYKAPYRYMERTWADDMQWGAAEVYKATGDEAYLADAKRYAEIIGDTSWMPLDDAGHYEFYPFVNVGHFALYPHVDEEFQAKLAGYYRAGIEATIERGKKNPYRIGVPFIWCSNNLTAALITQILLYEKMTGDTQYHDFMLAQRDWLLGCNPWGTTMFTGIPRDGEYPEDVHTSVWKLTGKMVPGGLVDGPVYKKVYDSLIGLHLTKPDKFAEFQNDYVVYHDDIGDYSTNEPTMDGTAEAIYLMAHFGQRKVEGDAKVNGVSSKQSSLSRDPNLRRGERVEGGIIRGPTDKKELSLIFTGSKYGEGTEVILDALGNRPVPAAFFLTGDYLAQESHPPLVERMIAEGHYVGPHSHGHLLYAPWEDRQETLVTEEEFKADLEQNMRELAALGASHSGARDEPVYFVPPYEWYNAQHARWAEEVGCVLVNFTPGSGSHRDWAPEDHRVFKPSTEIMADILGHEASAADGLNGHLLLLHLGSQREDKMHDHLGELLDKLHERGYTIKRIDELLSEESETE